MNKPYADLDFDLFLYENRTIDLYSKKSFDDVWENSDLQPNSSDAIPLNHRCDTSSNKFSMKQEDDKSYVIFVVEKRRLYVESVSSLR